MSTELEEHLFSVTVSSAKTADEIAGELSAAGSGVEIVSVTELPGEALFDPSQLYALVNEAPEGQRDAVRRAADLLVSVQNSLLGISANHASALAEIRAARVKVAEMTARTREALARSRAKTP